MARRLTLNAIGLAHSRLACHNRDMAHRFRLLVSLALATMPVAEAAARGLAAPRFFIDGTRNPALLGAIKRSVSPRVDVARRYSLAIVECGTGCVDYWLVDRQNGGVVEAPGKPAPSQIVWTVTGAPSSDVVRVTFGPSDGVGQSCTAQSFSIADGGRFKPVTPRTATRCSG